MVSKQRIQSVEPMIADLVNGWLKSYKLDYKLEQESLNSEIDKALNEYESKSGGKGGNRPDVKLLLQDKNLNYYPILIEYKGYKDKLVKLDTNGQVENKTIKNEPNYTNIKSYAINGAIHYANAILHYTSYADVISIGVTGYKNSSNNLEYSIGVYYVSKDNFGLGQEIAKYDDLSFLKKENFDEFIKKVNELSLSSEEIDILKKKREKEINTSLVALNNDIYKNEKGLGENDRVYLVAASIIATLGIPGEVSPLEKSDLKSKTELGERDGDIIIRKIEAFLRKKNLPEAKKDLIVRTLKNTLLTDNINKPINGESQLKRVFSKIVDDLGIYYKIGLTTDFTGKLFNEMYSWLGFTQDKLNDVVLTPSYIATFLVKLARVNKDSYVWDFATGSAGLLVAAMNEMIIDAKEKISSPEEFEQKKLKIKAEQLLGLEVLSNIYMLAILNMILMGDGSSNILNKDSLTDFNGNYGYTKPNEKFPATAFILNPPYSTEGNGMIFVEKALSMMNKGYASIIIQSSAGSGKAIEYNKKILKNNTLLASIKMPIDIFIGKSNVQTRIYVFRVGETHQKDDIVKFIDFSNDGYSRSNRKKSSNNLKDVDRAKERYQEVVNLVRYGKSKLNIFTEKEYYEGTIDPVNGADWNQSAPIDTKPKLDDFKKTISDYLAWEVSNILKRERKDNNNLSRSFSLIEKKLEDKKCKEYRLGDLFEIKPTKAYKKINSDLFNENGTTPIVTNSSVNNGVTGYTDLQATERGNMITYSDTTTSDGIFYQPYDFVGYSHIQGLYPILYKEKWNNKTLLYIVTMIKKVAGGRFNYGTKFNRAIARDFMIKLPIKEGEIDFEFMESFISEIEAQRVSEIEAYLSTIRLKNDKLIYEDKESLISTIESMTIKNVTLCSDSNIEEVRERESRN